MDFKSFMSSFCYLLILISLWGLVEMIIEFITKNVLISKIIIYALLFIVSTLIYIFVFNNELIFYQTKNLGENKIKNEIQKSDLI